MADDTIQYVRLNGRSGALTAGRDRSPIEPSEMFVMDWHDAFVGWQCWKNKRPIDTKKWALPEAYLLPFKEDLPEHGNYDRNEGWKRMIGFEFARKDTADRFQFAAYSSPGVGAVRTLLVSTHEKIAQPGGPCLPVFHFKAWPFEERGVTRFKPYFEIIDWARRESSG